MNNDKRIPSQYNATVNKLIALVLVLLVVIFLFVYVSSQKTLSLFTLSSSTTPTPKVQSSTEKNVIVQFDIKNKKLVDGPASLQVAQGSMVILQITSDQNGTFAFPGYNQHVPLVAGKTVVLSFLALHTGHFEYKVGGVTLGAIDIYPQ